MSSTETLVVANLGLSAGGCWFSTHKLLLYRYRSSLAGPVSIGASSSAVKSTLGGVPAPFACDLLRFGNCFRLALFLFTPAGSFNPLLKPSLLRTLASRRGGVGRYSYCED